MLNKDISEVLVIVTGGTFCMVRTPKGYMAAKGLIHRLKSYVCFNDEDKKKELNLGDD